MAQGGSDTLAATVAMPKPCRRPFVHAWGPSTLASANGPGDFSVGGRPRPGLEGPAGGLRRRRAERMDELEGAEQLGRDGDLAPVLGAALQGPYPDRGGLEVDVHGPDGQGLGDPGAGVGEREGEGLVGHDARAATSRKCRRSSVARYLRPQAVTSWRSRIRRDISHGVVSAQALLQGPAWGVPRRRRESLNDLSIDRVLLWKR